MPKVVSDLKLKFSVLSVYLGGFDMVVEVVAECLDVRDDIVSGLLCEVLWEKNCGS